GSACACLAGGGFTMSNTRNSTKASSRTSGVRGSASTESVMPATSSMTIAPGSFTPSARSARSAAHVPITVTATKKSTRPACENVDHAAHELGVALERHDVVRILDDRRALGRGLGVDLIGEVGRRRALFRRIREHAESIEAGVVEEAQEILERSGRLAGEADEHGRAQRDVGDRVAELANDLGHAACGHGAARGTQ